jgi:hypothetical protein
VAEQGVELRQLQAKICFYLPFGVYGQPRLQTAKSGPESIELALKREEWHLYPSMDCSFRSIRVFHYRNLAQKGVKYAYIRIYAYKEVM